MKEFDNLEDPEVWERMLEVKNFAKREPPRPTSAKAKNHWLRYKYGKSLGWFSQKLKQQNGRCAICALKISSGRGSTAAVVDHCHKTGTVRGILCQRCNAGLGMFRDSQSVLRQAAKYLQFFSDKARHERTFGAMLRTLKERS